MTELVEPKFEMDAFKKTIARNHVLPDLNGNPKTHLFFDANEKLIAVAHGPGPFFMQYFPLAYLEEMANWKAAKELLEETDRLERAAKAEAKRLEDEKKAAERNAHRDAMRNKHQKPDNA